MKIHIFHKETGISCDSYSMGYWNLLFWWIN